VSDLVEFIAPADAGPAARLDDLARVNSTREGLANTILWNLIPLVFLSADAA
jgi:hypothetical protein